MRSTKNRPFFTAPRFLWKSETLRFLTKFCTQKMTWVVHEFLFSPKTDQGWFPSQFRTSRVILGAFRTLWADLSPNFPPKHQEIAVLGVVRRFLDPEITWVVQEFVILAYNDQNRFPSQFRTSGDILGAFRTFWADLCANFPKSTKKQLFWGWFVDFGNQKSL